MADSTAGSTAGSTALTGLTVVVARPLQSAGPLVALLEARGARALVVPLIEVFDHASADDIESVLAPLTADDWVIVSSVHAADRVAHRLQRSPAQIAAVGATTAASLPRVDLVPPQQSAAGLLAVFPTAPIAGGRVVVAQAVGGEATLVDGTTTLGWTSSRLDTHISRTVVPTVNQQLAVLQADIVIFTSGSQSVGWVDVFGTSTPAIVAAIGPQTAAAAQACGLKVDVVAADHSL
ncbi:MAG: hemD, partial [Ilumatobacteraceae bacterium]|nr:hemD [Ilumatobacteraceae bacterium]